MFRAVATNFEPSEDLILIPGVPLDTLDFTSFTMNLGSKMVIDAQTKPERPPLNPPAYVMDPRGTDPAILNYRLAWSGMLVVQTGADGRAVVERLIHRTELAHMKLIVAVSPDVPLEDDELLLWGIFTRFDCARDLVPAKTEVHGAWVTYRVRSASTLTWKRGYPEPVENAPEVIERVNAWWGSRDRPARHHARGRFGAPRALIGMLHLEALPGSPGASLDVAAITEKAVREARIYRDAGFHAVMIENMHDRPYLKGAVGPEVVAAMAVIGREVRREVALPLGVQVLAGANREAIAVAHACGAAFVRVEGFVFAHVADEGVIEASAGDLLRYRRAIGAEPVRVLADVKKKHAAHAVTADVDVVETARAAEFFLADGVIVTGPSTGHAARPARGRGCGRRDRRAHAGGLGVTPENLGASRARMGSSSDPRSRSADSGPTPSTPRAFKTSRPRSRSSGRGCDRERRAGDCLPRQFHGRRRRVPRRARAHGRGRRGDALRRARREPLGTRCAVVSVAGSDYPDIALEALVARGVDLSGVRRLDRPGIRTWLLEETEGRRIVHQLGWPSHAEMSPRAVRPAGRVSLRARLPSRADAVRRSGAGCSTSCRRGTARSCRSIRTSACARTTGPSGVPCSIASTRCS